MTHVVGGDNDQARRDGEFYGKEVMSVDGCEGFIVFRDEQAADGLVVNVWQDRKRFDGFVPTRDALIAQYEKDTGNTVEKGRVYQVAYRG